MKTLTFILASLMGASLFGADSTVPPQNGNHPHEKNPAIEKALQECSATIGKDASGRPDMSKMDACMSAKGFKKPPQPPKDGGRPPMNGSQPSQN